MPVWFFRRYQQEHTARNTAPSALGQAIGLSYSACATMEAIMKRAPFVIILALIAVAAGLAQRQPPNRPVRLPSRGTRGAIAAGSEYATEAGMRMYFSGGNAIDAGIASMLAATVTEFSHIGLGGEAPILVRNKAGKVFAIAGVVTAPKLATADFYRNHVIKPDEMLEAPTDKGMKNWVPVSGILSTLVPGLVEGALVTLREFGTKSFGEAVQPAIDLADGFPIDELRVMSIANSLKHLEQWPASKRVFLPNGRIPMTGEIFRQPDLARTLRA